MSFRELRGNYYDVCTWILWGNLCVFFFNARNLILHLKRTNLHSGCSFHRNHAVVGVSEADLGQLFT